MLSIALAPTQRLGNTLPPVAFCHEGTPANIPLGDAMTDLDNADGHGPTMGRRAVMAGSTGLLGTVLAGAQPAGAQSATRRGTLVIGLDISDATSLDPVRVAQYSNPLPTHAAYDSLVTFAPGDYVNVKPCIATEWAYQPDGKTVRFKLRQDVHFASGNKMTAADVAFSFERVLNVKDQPAQYIAQVDHVAVVDDYTVDIVMGDPAVPLLPIIGKNLAHRTWRQRRAGRQDDGYGCGMAEQQFRRHRPLSAHRLAA
jgi:hypothetical protein